jgi:hypothetical protein
MNIVLFVDILQRHKYILFSKDNHKNKSLSIKIKIVSRKEEEEKGVLSI